MNLEKAHIDLLLDMIAIPAVSREERERSGFLERWLKGAGMTVTRVHNNLLVGETEEDSKGMGILLNSHMDTVPPVVGWESDPYSPLVDGDRITGLGSNDAGGSVVAMIAAYQQMQPKLRGRAKLFLLISAEEEISGERGIRSVLDHIGPMEAALVGEPTGMRPAVAERGLMVLDGTVHGVAGHAARSEGVNAILLAMKDIESIRNLKFSRASEWLPGPGAEVTMIHAGTGHNVIPDVCHYVVDVRSNDQYNNKEMLELLQSVCQAELKPRSTGLNASALGMDHLFMEAIRECQLMPFGSSTLSDMALIPFPAVKMGPGDSSRSHTAGEFITIPEMEQGVDIYCRFLESIGTLLENNETITLGNNQTTGQ